MTRANLNDGSVRRLFGLNERTRRCELMSAIAEELYREVDVNQDQWVQAFRIKDNVTVELIERLDRLQWEQLLSILHSRTTMFAPSSCRQCGRDKNLCIC